jgi:hypothetical protein
LAERCGDFSAAARVLGVPGPDLKRLTWARPHLLDAAEERCEEVVAAAMSQVIQALFSGDPRREMWASDKVLASWLARDHPLAPARAASRNATVVTLARAGTFVFQGDNDREMGVIDRDGKSISVPRRGAARAKQLRRQSSMNPPSRLFLRRSCPNGPGPYPPPPLVAHMYAPYVSPPRKIALNRYTQAGSQS